MPTDARMRLESVSKIYTAALTLQLAQDGKLRVGDTVDGWLPGLLPYGSRITIRELLTMSSGLIDNNDLRNAPASVQRTYLARVKDAKLRAQLRATLGRVAHDQAAVVPESFWIRWAAWQPLLFTPGGGYPLLQHRLRHPRTHRRPGRRRAPGRALPRADLPATRPPRDRLRPARPSERPSRRGLRNRAQRHANPDDRLALGVGAEGGIVSNAKDTATFLTALMRGKLLDRQRLAQMKGKASGVAAPSAAAAAKAYGWSGGGSAYKTDVWVNHDGSRVAILLLNARHYDTAQPEADQAAHDALATLYCGA